MQEFNEDYLDPELMVPVEIKDDRLKICIRCDSYTPPICKECSCIVGMMVSYTFKSCPKNKW